MKKIILSAFLIGTLFLTGCGRLFSIGANDFSCPHVRSKIYCMPPSEVEKLDEAGKLDWKWHSYSGKTVKSECSLANAEAYLKLCGPGGMLAGEPICKAFAERCIPEHKTIFLKGAIAPEGASPDVEFK